MEEKRDEWTEEKRDDRSKKGGTNLVRKKERTEERMGGRKEGRTWYERRNERSKKHGTRNKGSCKKRVFVFYFSDC